MAPPVGKKPEPPGAGPGAGAPCGGKTPCPPPPSPAPVKVEIEINQTPATSDDIVQLKCEHPSHRHTVPCRIRLVDPLPPGPVTVVLINPDGHLRFPNSADTTRALRLPANGSWVPFDITGETASTAKDDAKIEAHRDSAGGAVVGTKDVTVFWFDQAKIDITATGTYSITGGRFTTIPDHAVDYSAQARIRPAGVDCAAPQVKDLRIGIMQNKPIPGIREVTWDTPAIDAWYHGVASGTTVSVPSTFRLTFPVVLRPTDFWGMSNDSDDFVAPLYDQPGKPGGTVDPDSLKPPIGCAGGTAATSFDIPSTSAPATFLSPAPARSADGEAAANVVYKRLVNVTMKLIYITWAVVYNTVTEEFCTLRERTWVLDVDSAGAAPQRASVPPSDNAPTITPVTTPFSKPQSNDPANRRFGPVGAATTPFTR